ncbi:MAG TPA: J domain-containing protein [Kofleriaceae bacterium]|nr:J domain-containing protein [Kofleriaceae bacterium]
MSLTRRILETAKSGISSLTSLVIVDDEPLANVEAAALEAEVAARKKARKERPGQSRIGKLASATVEARAERARQAADRSRKVKGERETREANARRAADDAFRRIKEQAARGGGPSSSSSSTSGSSGSRTGSSGGSARAAKSSGGAQVAEWYKTLNLSPGADLAEVKSSYRQLMRKYHPDMHAGNPQKQKAATELSMRVTTAYNGLVSHFEKK